MRAGELIGNVYRLKKVLGRGSFGTVWLASDIRSGSQMVLKVLHATWMADEKTVKRFNVEYLLLSQLHHQYIVEANELLHLKRTNAIVMPYLRGGSLADRLRLVSWLPLATVIDLAIKLLRALETTHRLDVVHRDIKPENILFSDDSYSMPKLADFGLAHLPDHLLTSSRATTTPRTMGTLLYMSPEQLNGDALDIRSDLYSLGMTLYRALAGRLFFDEHQLGPIEIQSAISRPSRERPSRYRPDLPAWMDKFILALIAYKIYDRPDNPLSAIKMIPKQMQP
jgi:eukaryotic-like serine/threonine-protein kinase